MCLSPLMFDVFYANLIAEGIEPIMSEQGYKFIYTFIAFAVIPGAIASPFLYDKYGPGLSCVCANALTGCIILVLLYVALLGSTTVATFAIFVTIFFISFPATVISQISTGPMLDR